MPTGTQSPSQGKVVCPHCGKDLTHAYTVLGHASVIIHANRHIIEEIEQLLEANCSEEVLKQVMDLTKRIHPVIL